MDARRWSLSGALVAALALMVSSGSIAADPKKVLHIAQGDLSTLAPHTSNDIWSTDVQRAIFEALYEWDYLARPTHLVPNTAAALPVISDEGKLWTIRVHPGIYFTEDPAFHGAPRELVAEDYVYSLKRVLDPQLPPGGAPITTDAIVGARAAVDAARKLGAKFDYDTPIAGLRAVDRYTVQIKLTQASYPIIENFLTNLAVAREVVEAAGDQLATRPVGTGPYLLQEWRRGSRVVLEANPNYRAIAFPESTDPAHRELVRTMRNKKLPQIGRIEIALIDEELPMLLEFERSKLDSVRFTTDIPNRLLENGKLKPAYAKLGIAHYATPRALTNYVYFNIEDPVLGGLSSERIALRRAILLGFDVERMVDVVYGGQAQPSNQMVPPLVTGHDPSIASKAAYDANAANALLNRFGFAKRDETGYRMTPEGKPLAVTMLTRPDKDTRDAETLWKKNMDAIGLRIQFRELPLQDLAKESAAGNYQMLHGLGWGGSPLGFVTFIQLYGKEPPMINRSRFKLAEYDQAMEQYLQSPTERQQAAAAKKMTEIARNYLPMSPTVVRLVNDFTQPWLMGFAPSQFGTYWKYLDIDLARRGMGHE